MLLFIVVFMTCMLSFFQGKNNKLSQILKSGPFQDLFGAVSRTKAEAQLLD